MGKHRRPMQRHVPLAVRSTVWTTLLAALLVVVTGAFSAPARAAERDNGGDTGGYQSDSRYSYRDNGDGNGDRQDKEKPDKQEQAKPAGATCRIKVPAAPLTATGLATPYELSNGAAECHMADPNTAAFVEATIVSADGALSVYRPLVIDAGTDPAALPVTPVVPPGATVAVWFGFQGDTLDVVGPGSGACVDGLGGSLFGQFAYCNAPAFFRAAQASATASTPLGQALDGRTCPTVRDFSVVDQDQSDNVTTQYLLTADGRTLQDTTANRAAFPDATVLLNASDNGLLDRKIDPALGCAPPTAPDLTDPAGAPVASLALNELQAMQQAAPVALIPVNDPMAQVNGQFSVAKTSLYRAGVGQPVTNDLFHPRQNAQTYCQRLVKVGLPRLKADRPYFTVSTSPTPGMNLYDFMIDRFKTSLKNLNCQ